MTTNRLAVLVLIVAAGCADGPKAAPVEPEKARQALRTALDAWKAGKPIESLAQADPPIVAQDFDWMAGAKLLDYEVLGDGTPEDANLRVRAKLTLGGPKAKGGAKTVTYVVGTDPKLTVFRAME